jgi:glycine/D-amino acid oxidase-like deaminating enzyme
MTDDRTGAYIIEVHKHFEDLHQVASQFAGLLVLAAASGKNAVPDHPMLEAARRLHQEASDGLLTTRTTERARVHHHYLVEAAAALRSSLAQPEVGLALAPLRTAYAHLEAASRSLPGFELVSFEHACCTKLT